MTEKWSVVVSDNYAPTKVILFPTERKANDFVKEDYAKCLAEEVKEQSGWDEDQRTLRVDESHCDVDEGFGYAIISWETEWTGANPDERDTKTWEVVEATELKEGK